MTMLISRGTDISTNSFSKAISRRKSTMPIFSNDDTREPAAITSITGNRRMSPKKRATGHDAAATIAVVPKPRMTLMVKALSYTSRDGCRSRITASSTPSDDSWSIACAKLIASVTRPKSAGSSRRTRNSVLTSPRMRVTMRQPMTQPAPFAVLARIELPADGIASADAVPAFMTDRR